MKNETRLKKVLAGMFKEKTGTSMLDSGGAYGRHWQRNEKIKSFEALPIVTVELYGDRDNTGESLEVIPTVNAYRFLKSRLELNDLCNEFNAKFKVMGDWDSKELYGCSIEAEKYLKEHFEIGATTNTYNYDSNLSQILQYTSLIPKNDTHEDRYVFLQVHNGCDARGGYTDGKLFKVRDSDYMLFEHGLYGTLTRKDGTNVSVDLDIGSCTLKDENGHKIETCKGDKVELYMLEF